MPSEEVEYVRGVLAKFYDMSIVVLPRVEMPSDAYYHPRNRYRAEILLAYLKEHRPTDSFRIVGLTDQDISTVNGAVPDWGVIGLAMLGGPSCIVSSARCGRAESGATRRRVRLGKAAVHEVGHNLGLSHCATPGCLMNDANGRARTIDGEYDLCSRCRAILDGTDRTLLAHHSIPSTQPESAMPLAHLESPPAPGADADSTNISRD